MPTPSRGREPSAPAASAPVAVAEGDDPLVVVASDDRALESARRRKRVVGAGLAAALLVAAGAVGITQAVQRHAHTVATEAVTAAALDYLTAIAEGRGDDATALVPVDSAAPLLTDAALANAVLIEQHRVEGVEISDDAATIELAYRAGGRLTERTVQAVREGESWRIMTSLAEPVRLDAAHALASPRYLGVELGGRDGTLLYPGMYDADPLDHPLVDFEPLTIIVDGDPSTAAVSGTRAWRVADGVVETARERALAHVADCARAGTCSVSGAVPELADFTSVSTIHDGIVEFDVPLLETTGGDVRVTVRASADDAGEIDWQCAGPAAVDPRTLADGAWEACA